MAEDKKQIVPDVNYGEVMQTLRPQIQELQQAYGIDPTTGNAQPDVWYKSLGLNPNALKQQQEADAKSARYRSKANAIAQTFMAANDLFGNMIGARMPKRDTNNRSAENNAKESELRTLIAAEDAAKVKEAGERQKAYGKSLSYLLDNAIDGYSDIVRTGMNAQNKVDIKSLDGSKKTTDDDSRFKIKKQIEQVTNNFWRGGYSYQAARKLLKDYGVPESEIEIYIGQEGKPVESGAVPSKDAGNMPTHNVSLIPKQSGEDNDLPPYLRGK